MMTAVETLSVALTPELADDVRRAVASGEYDSTSEVIRDALRAWTQARQDRPALASQDLQRLWREGVDSGQSQALDADAAKRGGQSRLASTRSAAR